MVNVGGTKMSKSLGNFTTIRALLDSGVSAMTLRLFVLQAHYRKPLDFTAEALEAASSGWKKLNAALALGEQFSAQIGWPEPEALPAGAMNAQNISLKDDLRGARDRFIEVMDQDLNSSGALAVLFELAKPLKSLANRLDRSDSAEEKDDLNTLHQRWLLLRELAAVLGLRHEPLQTEADSPVAAVNSADIEAAISARKTAKQAKDFAEADRIRDELTAQGIELIDKPGGVTEWRQA